MTDGRAASRRPREIRSAPGLRRLNVVVGCLHSVQAIALLGQAVKAETRGQLG